MSLFRKPKKNIQRRVLAENTDDDDDGGGDKLLEIQECVAVKKNESNKKKSKHQKAKQTLLSFETEEDEGEVFQIKKSSHSKKVMKMYERERQKKKESHHQQQQQKVEKEEKIVKSNENKEKKTEIITDDLVLVVNSNHKTPQQEQQQEKQQQPLILSGRDALCAGKNDLSSEEEEENSTSIHKFSKPDNFKRVLESGYIPDAAMIHAARKRRQRAREMGDFVPIEDQEEPEDKGRLMRDDDNDGSDDERIDMDVNLAVLRDQERRREQFLAAQDSDQEVDDEWEHQQIRKGVTGASSLAPSELIYSEYLQQQQQPEMNQINPQQQQQPQIQAIDPGVPRTPEMIACKLREHYQNVCNSRETNSKKLEQIHEEMQQITNDLDELKAKAPIAAERFKFYQELRGYVTDLVECLDEKIAIIENLEQRAMEQLAKRSEWLIERRRQDVRDQAEEATNPKQQTPTIKSPEDEDKVRRAAEREGRRTRRRRARELCDQPKHVEGMSSDDEVSQQDLLNFDKEREQIDLEIQQVFNDVVEDYSTIENILIKFEEWRDTDLTSYNEAYATLCLPKIISPLIRLDLIFWDPLNISVDIEKLDWYRTLALYGLHNNETETSLAQDPDLNLLPIIVEKVIVPKLTQLVDKCWDPLSNSQTLRLIGIIQRYIRKFPTLNPVSKTLNNLFNAILHKMKLSLEHDVFIPLTPKLIESRSVFFQRQFASGLKLLKNITSWQGILNDKILKELALKSLLNRYLLSAIKFCILTDAVSKVSLISLILPRVWLQNSTPELDMFTNNVMNLSQQLDKNNPLHLESIEIINNILKTLRN